MYILLISSPIGFGSTLSKVHTLPSIGIYRIQNFLCKHGFTCDIFDADLEDLQSFLHNSQQHYDIIAISGTYFSMDACLEIVSTIKKKQDGQGFLVVGGVVSTYAPQLWLDLGFDAAILGYGEYPFLHLCRIVRDYGTMAVHRLSEVDGLAYYADGVFCMRAAPALTSERFRELTYENMLGLAIPYERYWKYNEQFLCTLDKKNFYFALETVNVYTSSQCPNRCGYCNGKFLDQAQQTKAKLYFLDEEDLFSLVVALVQKHNPKLVYFSDDDFLFSKPRATAFARKIVEAKRQGFFPRHVDFGCQSRVVNLLKNGQPDVDFLSLLAEAGFKPITVGAESCTPSLLQTPLMNKGGYSGEQVFALAQAMLEKGLVGGVNFMLMLPDSTRCEMLRDLESAYQLLTMGIEIRVTVRVLAQFGAPALQLPQYKVETRELVSPLNGYRAKLPQYFLLQNAELQDSMNRYAEILPMVEEEITKKYHLQERRRNSFFGLTRCLALARALDDALLCEKFEHAAQLWFGPA